MKLKSPRYLPWSSWGEWRGVEEKLTSWLESDRRKVVSIGEVWRARGKLPHAVDSTLLIVEAHLEDPGFATESSSFYRKDVKVGKHLQSKADKIPEEIHPLCFRSPDTVSRKLVSSTGSGSGSSSRASESQLRLQYSAIVVRTINGFVDQSQQGYYADSVLAIAKRIGLPEWVVDLRHDSTHNQLPSLSVLRAASEELLRWLYNYYWKPQYSLLESLEADIVSIVTRSASDASDDCDMKPEGNDHVSGSSSGSNSRSGDPKRRQNLHKEQSSNLIVSNRPRSATYEIPFNTEEAKYSHNETVRDSLTYITDIFIPVFLEMVVQAPALDFQMDLNKFNHTSSKSEQEIETEMEGLQFKARKEAEGTAEVSDVLWRPLMEELYLHNNSSRLVLLCHLLFAGRNTSNELIKEFDTEIQNETEGDDSLRPYGLRIQKIFEIETYRWWIKTLCRRFIIKDDNNMYTWVTGDTVRDSADRITIALAVDVLRGSVMSVRQETSCVPMSPLQDMCDTLSHLCDTLGGIESLIENNSDGSFNKTCDNTAIILDSTDNSPNKRQRKTSPSSSSILQNTIIWPMGLLPGQFSVPNLTLCEIVNSDGDLDL
jgi:hypothetical protein